MNERVPVEFSVEGVIFRRQEETYTARIEINWGIQALPFVFEQVIVGTTSEEYLAADEELSDDALLAQYPPSVVVPGFAFTALAVCQMTVTIFVTAGAHAGIVRITSPQSGLHQWVDGQWADADSAWSQSIPAVVLDPTSNVNGTTYSHDYSLFVGDPSEACSTDTPTPPTGGGGGGSTVTIPSAGGGNMGNVATEPPSSPNASVPGCVTVTEWTCPTPAADATCSRACQNPFYAMDNPGECDAVSVTSIRVEPATVRSGVGRRGVYRVVAVFSNGQQGDVTSEATVSVADQAKAVLRAAGVIGGVAAGSTALNAAWKGRTATAPVEVFASTCTGPWDVVFVLDQATAAFWFSSRPVAPGCGIYWRRTLAASDYVAEYGTAATALMLGLSLKNPWDSDAGADRVSIVVTGDGSPKLAATWSDTVLSVSGLCKATTDSRLGEALRAAKAMLASARSGAQKLVVLFSSGSESVCSPSARTAANELVTAGSLVAVVTPLHASMPWTLYSACTYPETALAYLESLASDCLFLSDPAGLDALGLLAGVQAAHCGCP